ncbi:MAG: hypothetical protein L7S62_02230 [Flavobacteriales bacterium]|nr:hypothetical protein [Flavobacteriales bacterium]
MKIRITIELEVVQEASEIVPETDTIDTSQTTLSDAAWRGYSEGRKDMEQEIIEATTVADLLDLQERVNSQIGQPKMNYGEGRKTHSCARCGAEHRRALERLNGRCLDCEDILDASIEWQTRGV